ncbi:MAG: hypothetical protein J6O41_02200 [Clostridia bacterium]|nr:hypothetical protein [Clostridia bacterium]
MPFNPRSLKNLRRIVDITKGKIILTSSWRLSDRCMIVLKARLIEYGIKIFSQTERLDGNRGNEITQWLKDNGLRTETVIFSRPDYYGFQRQYTIPDYINLIIDDEVNDISNQFDYSEVIQTDMNIGLDFWKTREVINKYNYQKDCILEKNFKW